VIAGTSPWATATQYCIHPGVTAGARREGVLKQPVQSFVDAAATLLTAAFAADPIMMFLFADKADAAQRRRALFDF
jgi:hypothetical protein